MQFENDLTVNVADAEIPVVKEIRSTVRDLHEMQEAVTTLKQRIKELTARIGSEVISEDQRIDVARYLYWFVPDVSPKILAKELIGDTEYRLRELIGKAVADIVCERCVEPIEFESRAHFQEIIKASNSPYRRYREGYRVLCKPCWKALQDERHAEYEVRDREYQLRAEAYRASIEAQQNARLNQLRTMPYREYLQTDEWRNRRQRHLESVGHRCQVCNAGRVILDVHHRTYERRGNELYTDLIVLCRTCHDIFHTEGRLST